ncbi:CoA transferase [Pseudonocardia ailaonensis]|uniref:CoA transferase n=1 Tax=Pseudonocardia ailaonensis TaxID=367279 RepID=A0ABN2MHJ4_9PSEU
MSPVGTAPLHGLQVLDLTTGVAGPIVGQFLADFGAEVVKVEPPSGDPARALPGFAVWNRGKRSIVEPSGPTSERLRALVAGADVLLVTTRDQLDRVGLDREALLREHPTLLLTEVPPYAGDAPWHGGHESNGLLAAAAGVAWRQSSFDGGPVEQVSPHLLYVHGLWATVCTVAALTERERSGFGQVVSVNAVNGVQVPAFGSMTVDPAEDDPPTDIGPGGRHPTYTRHQAGDGLWLASGALGGKFELALLGMLGLSHLLEDDRMGGRIENLILPANYTWLAKEIRTAFLSRPRDEWLAMMPGLGIPCGPVEQPGGWLDHEQIKAIGMRAEVDDAERGRVVMPGIPLVLTGSPGRVTDGAPTLGAHDGEDLARAPRPVPAGKPPMSAGPLRGYRIVDMGTFVAGPYAGSLLAELGADVVKLEPAAGDPFRSSGFVVNRGMRSVAIDLRTPAGLAAFRELAAVSDVVLDSLRPGVTAKLGIDHDSLAEVRPDIVTVSLSAFGAAGPLAHRPGVDMVLSAMSGMMIAQGGDDEPVVNTMPLIDATTAAMLVLTTTLSLYHHERTGEGQHAWSSLAASAAFLQSGELVDFAGRPPAPVGGRDLRGFGPFDRYYRVADGWLRIQTTDRPSAEDLARHGIVVRATEYEADPAAELAAALAGLGAVQARDRFAALGIASHPARLVSEVVRDPDLVAQEIVHVRQAASTYVSTGRYATFGRTPRFGPLHPPGKGEHTRSVLRGAGLTDELIDQLERDGVVETGPPMEQRVPTAYR